MSGPVLDASVRLATAIARDEACEGDWSAVQPPHFLLAILNVVDDAYHQHATALGLTAEELAAIPTLAREARSILGFTGEELTRQRRRLLTWSRRGGGFHHDRQSPHTHEIASRSQDILDQGGTFASMDGARATSVVHVLRAILTSAADELRDILQVPLDIKPTIEWETRMNEYAARLQLNRVALAMSDVVGSIDITRKHGDVEAFKIFRLHDDLVREQLGHFAGAAELGKEGDSFLIAFTAEADAIAWALTIQSKIRHEPTLSRIPVRVRIGIHSGEVLSRGPEYGRESVFGIAIDTTARIASLAGGNQILTSRDVRDVVASGALELPDGVAEIEWRLHGAYDLKGLTRPVDIFEVGEKGLASFQKPDATAKVTPVADRPVAPAEPARPRPGTPSRHGHQTPVIDTIGRDLTRLARDGRLAPVIGRRREMRMLARHLQRTTKRNVMIIGDPGVGKTAVVEGLAQRAAAPDAPEVLRGLRIVQIDVADLVAGAKYRGDLEQRVQALLNEAESDPGMVLFIDEVHLVVRGAGEGADIANLLKPALTRAEFRCIGATTTEEFERHIKNDAAFLRRFQLLRVGEPDLEESLEMSTAWARRIESAQQVRIEDDAITAAVLLSNRLLRDRRLPDKAIDLLENAVTWVKLSSLSEKASAPTKGTPVVTRGDVEAVLEEQYQVSVRRADALDPDEVAARLSAELVGQSGAIRAIVDALEGMTARDARRDGPLGVFLFLGPTGVGKTATAEWIADALFGRAAFARINMNEFRERHEIARLIGAPPGFIGHEQAGSLFRFVESAPQGLILLDEVEKAHPEVLDYFLQLFDKGEALDSRGRKADFRQHLFIMTSNVGSRGETAKPIGFGRSGAADAPSMTVESLREWFRPEFLGRIDRIVTFRALGPEDYDALLARYLEEARRDLEEQGIRLEIDAGVQDGLRQAHEEGGDGVRGLRRFYERAFLAPLNQYVSDDQPAVVRATWEGGRVVLTPA
ncbi:MAG: AAA family ATPase [Gemmatimonadetes bacterium]|nr:AAA family ATPase [Gemmatimonadota bacterium]